MYGNCINAHLSDLAFLRDLDGVLPKRLQMFIQTSQYAHKRRLSFIDPNVDESLVIEIFKVIHSTFTIQTNKSGRIQFAQFKDNIEEKRLYGQEVVFLFVALMRALGADASLVSNFSDNICNTIFWAEIFMVDKNDWIPVDPLTQTINFTVICTKIQFQNKDILFAFLLFSIDTRIHRNQSTTFSVGKTSSK